MYTDYVSALDEISNIVESNYEVMRQLEMLDPEKIARKIVTSMRGGADIDPAAIEITKSMFVNDAGKSRYESFDDDDDLNELERVSKEEFGSEYIDEEQYEKINKAVKNAENVVTSTAKVVKTAADIKQKVDETKNVIDAVKNGALLTPTGLLGVFQAIVKIPGVNKLCVVIGHVWLNMWMQQNYVQNKDIFQTLTNIFATVQDEVQDDLPTMLEKMAQTKNVAVNGWLMVIFMFLKYPDLLLGVFRELTNTVVLYNAIQRTVNVCWATRLIYNTEVRGVSIMKLVEKGLDWLNEKKGAKLDEWMMKIRERVFISLGIASRAVLTVADMNSANVVSRVLEMVGTQPEVVAILIACYYGVYALLEDFKKCKYKCNVIMKVERKPWYKFWGGVRQTLGLCIMSVVCMFVIVGVVVWFVSAKMKLHGNSSTNNSTVIKQIYD